MSQDIVSDTLNAITNAKRAGKTLVETRRFSKLLISVLALAKLKGYIKNYTTKSGVLTIEIGQLNRCQAIKPRFEVQVKDISKYVSRYLPSKNLGILIISTSKGLMAHDTSLEKNIGGSLIAYIY
jgi:ribosomal protein S8